MSVGGAPAGGGGALRDLQRGLASATIDPCAGSGRDMLGVSGIVPDGVEAVFVTAADGSATRADVHDNGYAFVLPRPRRPEPRYVVWTGADGTPHVQPLPAFLVPGRAGACRNPDELVRVTPDPWGGGCAAAIPPALLAARPPRGVVRARPRPSRIVRPRPGRRGAPARPVAPLAPAPFAAGAGLCAGGAAAVPAGPAPALARGAAALRRAAAGRAPLPRPARVRPGPRAAPDAGAARRAGAAVAPAPRPAPPRGP